MGPAATVDFMKKLTEVCGAERDQEHLPVLTFSLPQIPDRSAALLGRGASPYAAMRSVLKVLENAGVGALAIPCNTAHFWHDELKAETGLPVLHIVDAVLKVIADRFPGPRRVAVLGTEATWRLRLYDKKLQASGHVPVYPEPDEQEQVQAAIRAVKAGRPMRSFPLADTVARLEDRGADVIVLACTELPLLFEELPDHIIDSTLALAWDCLSWARTDRLEAIAQRR